MVVAVDGIPLDVPTLTTSVTLTVLVTPPVSTTTVKAPV